MFGFSKSAKVTDEEQKNLITSLRGRLSDGSQPVEEQLRAGGEVGLQGLDDVSLGRWLAAENWDIGKAEKRLRPHAVWRKSEFPDGRVSEVLKARLVPLQANCITCHSFFFICQRRSQRL